MPKLPLFLRYRLEYALFSTLRILMTALPVETASAVGGQILCLLGPLSRKRHPRLLQNLALAYPDMSESERKRLASAVWRNLGRVVGELFHLREIVQNRLDFENPEMLESLVSGGGGTVMCGAHQANWEIGGGILVRLGFTPIGVYHPMSNPLVEAAVRRCREPFYPGGLLAKRGPTTPQRVMRHTLRGGTAAFLVDENTHTGLPVPFFGRDATSTTFPAILARSQGKPLGLAHITRQDGVRFTVRWELIEVPRSADKQADIAAATAALHAAIERSVRKRPDQWMWTQTRWR